MAQPIKLSPQELINRFSTVTRDDLINDFQSMNQCSTTITRRTYTHFIPKLSYPEYIGLTESYLQAFCPIRECNCSEHMTRGRRRVVEIKTLKKVEEIFNKNKPLTVHSIGSGSCYPELSFGVGLAQNGFDVREIVLVDTAYAKSGGLLGMDEKFALDQFKDIFKRLFPCAVVSVYEEESEYFEDIKNSKQQKPDIILCVDVPIGTADSRKAIYSKMLESPNHQCVFAYHNYPSPLDTSSVITVIETI